MNKLYLILIACILLNYSSFAQIPEDALRLSYTSPSGTARQQAIGGAMGSLGGDLTAAYINPAGLAFYKTGDFIISPGFRFLSDKSDYRGTTTSGKTASNFNLGTSGFVFGLPRQDGSTGTFSIAVSRTANFGSNVHYKGANDYSSYAEQFAEQFAGSGLSIDDAISTPQLSYGTRMALYTYLIDTATINGNAQVIALPLRAGLLNQENTISTRGGITEIAISYAVNKNDKWYIGGSLGIPIVNYTRNTTFTESDATGNTNNDFAYSTYNETYNTSGFGLNAKLGVIYKPVTSWRVGLAIHTPTIYGLKDHISANMTTNTENYAKEISVSSDILDNGTGTTANAIGYDITTPWKFVVSGSYLFSESADVTQQRGFVTADIGYTTHSSSRYSPEDKTDANENYFSDVNSAIKSSYKGVFDLRLGGELKFNTFMARAGVAYYATPYKESDLKASRLLLSGGIGYRHKGMFIDLSYIQSMTKDVNFPYRLADKANTFATVKETGGTVLLTVGFKFF